MTSRPFHHSRPVALIPLMLAVVLLAGCTTEDHEPTEREDTKTITVPAGGGVEYKLFLEEGAELQYTWTAGASLFYDFHGDREGADPDEFTSHDTGTLASDGGTFVAPFTGRHGWYWENRHSGPIEVRLETSGVYDVVGFT